MTDWNFAKCKCGGSARYDEDDNYVCMECREKVDVHVCPDCNRHLSSSEHDCDYRLRVGVVNFHHESVLDLLSGKIKGIELGVFDTGKKVELGDDYEILEWRLQLKVKSKSLPAACGEGKPIPVYDLLNILKEKK